MGDEGVCEREGVVGGFDFEFDPVGGMMSLICTASSQVYSI